MIRGHSPKREIMADKYVARVSIRHGGETFIIKGWGSTKAESIAQLRAYIERIRDVAVGIPEDADE